MFRIFASPVLYKAVVYEPTPVKTPPYKMEFGPVDKKPTVFFKNIFEQIIAIRANIDKLIVEVFLKNEESYLFNGDGITPNSNSILYDNIVDIRLDAEWKDIEVGENVEKTCVTIQAVFVSSTGKTVL